MCGLITLASFRMDVMYSNISCGYAIWSMTDDFGSRFNGNQIFIRSRRFRIWTWTAVMDGLKCLVYQFDYQPNYTNDQGQLWNGVAPVLFLFGDLFTS